MLENVLSDRDIKFLLRCNPKVIDKTLRSYISDNLDDSELIIKVFKLTLIADIYLSDIDRNSLSGSKRVVLRNQEIKFLEIISCIKTMRSIYENTSLSCKDINTICTMFNQN